MPALILTVVVLSQRTLVTDRISMAKSYWIFYPALKFLAIRYVTYRAENKMATCVVFV